jgi:hypothetical protein
MSNDAITRRSQRKLVTMAAQCRTQSGLRDKGRISDISAEGCCISTDGLFFKVGTRIVIRPDGMEGLTGVVRWTAGDKAGVEFDVPIYGPIIDHLAIHYSAGKQVNLNTL